MLTPCDHPSKPCKNICWGKRWWTRKTWVVKARLVWRGVTMHVLALLLRRSGVVWLPVRWLSWLSDLFTVNFSQFLVPAVLISLLALPLSFFSLSNLLNTPFPSSCLVIDWKWIVYRPWFFFFFFLRCVSEKGNVQAVVFNALPL